MVLGFILQAGIHLRFIPAADMARRLIINAERITFLPQATSTANDYSELNITMSRVGTEPPAVLRGGITVNYETTIMLPTISE